MANLLVRNVDDRIAVALRERAGRENISAEALHRKILEETLLSRRKTFAEVIASMADVGSDADFERKAQSDRPHVSD